MENHNIVWVGMDTDAKNNHVALYRGWDKEPSAEWKTEMDAPGIKKLSGKTGRSAASMRPDPAATNCIESSGRRGFTVM